MSEYANYVEEFFTSAEDRELAQILTFELLRYLKNYKENNILTNTDGFQLKQLPYFLNPFIHHKAHELKTNLNDTRIVQMCTILLKMAEWLKANSYTDLIIEYN